MSASENKAATQAAYQAFGAGDLEGAMKDMADDIEWIEPGDSTISGTYRGKDEVARFFMTLASKSFRTEPQHFVADGDHVVVPTRITVDGQSADQADVLTFRGDKVAKSNQPLTPLCRKASGGRSKPWVTVVQSRPL